MSNPWQDDPEGDARFAAGVGRIEAALLGPQLAINLVRIGLGLLLAAAALVVVVFL